MKPFLVTAAIAFAQTTREVKDKGPGGHILTGPVEIAEAMPGHVLEVQILKVDINVPFACNGFGTGRGFLPNDYPYSRSRIIPLDREKRRALTRPHHCYLFSSRTAFARKGTVRPELPFRSNTTISF
jgi:hypothetical protein